MNKRIMIQPAQTYWTAGPDKCLICSINVPPGSKLLGIYDNNLLVEHAIQLVETKPETMRLIAIPLAESVEVEDPSGELVRGPQIGLLRFGARLTSYVVFFLMKREQAVQTPVIDYPH